MIICSESELTWFTKGLRQKYLYPVHSTYLSHVRIDLIYEGIATQGQPPNRRCFCMSELTWFTKGLRPVFQICIITDNIHSPNWPDLRRDCDSEPNFSESQFFSLSELTWFTKGLRLSSRGLLSKGSLSRSELTWFTKGLRPIFIASVYVHELKKVRIDLIYEGIATSICIFSFSAAVCCPNWPDLRRDCDFFLRTSMDTNAPESPNWPDLRRDCDLRSVFQLHQHN